MREYLSLNFRISCVLTTNLLLIINSIYCNAQPIKRIQVRHVIKNAETWKPGIIMNEQHVVDSFFYDNGILNEVVESIIKHKHYILTDSFTVNTRKHWDINGNLILIENFKNGKVNSIENYYPKNKNIIENGSFEKHSTIPKHIVFRDKRFDLNCGFAIKKRSSIIINSTVENNDTTLTELVIDSINCVNNLQSIVFQHVVIKKNSEFMDSIYIDFPKITNSSCDISSIMSGRVHWCNYDSVKIDVPGWESIGNKFPNIYDLQKNSPNHPLQRYATHIFDFEGKTGNNFTAINSWLNPFQLCNPWSSHKMLQTKLKTTLQKGQTYYLEFWLWKPYDTSKEYAPKLNVCVTDNPITIKNYSQFKKEALIVNQFNDSTVGKWIKASLTFKATCFARYLSIGFFSDYESKSKYSHGNIHIPKGFEDSRFARCYLDDFILTTDESKDSVENCFFSVDPKDTIVQRFENNEDTFKPIVFDGKEIQELKPVELENIYFEVDSYKLLPESNTELNKLITFIQGNNEMNIEICGHTDNTGDEAYNQYLSENRAKAVVSYLIDKGVPNKQLTWKGYGSKKPKVDNVNEANKQKNRRVEFVIQKR